MLLLSCNDEWAQAWQEHNVHTESPHVGGGESLELLHKWDGQKKHHFIRVTDCLSMCVFVGGQSVVEKLENLQNVSRAITTLAGMTMQDGKHNFGGANATLPDKKSDSYSDRLWWGHL